VKLISKIVLFFLFVTAITGAGLYYNKHKTGDQGLFVVREIKPETGYIRLAVSTTGVVEPQNRLEIKPPINGRLEEIFVKEGDQVKEGQIIAVMSSTERAALLDAARAQGEKAIAYWKDVYKATPLIAPINGEVIVRDLEPGQTVTSETAVIVLSDRLIVNAQVDETDIGRIKKGQKSIFSLDAYPEMKIEGIVDHIAYESQLVNNVNIYEADIIPQEIPDFFRSGMSATIDIIITEKNNVLKIPEEAIQKDDGESFVQVKKGDKSIKTKIEPGIISEGVVEIVSGLNADDTILLATKKYGKRREQASSSPFMPYGKRKSSGH